MATHAAHAPTPELIFDSLLAYQRTAALRAAIEIDLFRAIGEGPGDVESLARRCAASERGIRILCDFLTIQGLLLKSGGRYAHTPTSAVFLDPQSPACIASTARFLGSPMLREPFESLAQTVRTGRFEDLVPHHCLHDARGVAHIQEGHPTVITPTGHPAGQSDGCACVLGAQGACAVGADHEIPFE